MLLGLVILHELGHFWAARRADIEVEEFGIGFPPRAKILGEKDGTVYTLNWLPLGGFVKLKGEHDSDTQSGSFGAATLRQKVLVMVAGVVMNVLAAVVLLSIIAAVGIPKVFDNQFTVAGDTEVVQHDVLMAVAPDSPAAVAGLRDGDKIRAIADKDCTQPDCQVRINESTDLRGATESLAGREVVITIVRSGSDVEELVNATLLSEEVVRESRNTDNPKGYLGVVPSDYIKQQSTWSAPIVGAVTTAQFFGETLRGLGGLIADLFRGDGAKASEQVTGVVGIGYILSELSAQGFMAVLFLTAIISISLAVMNILPIPALDGGRLFVTLIFRVLRRPLSKETEERIHGTGFAMLMALFVLITILDVQKFILD